jgi:Ca2+-binding RTX toxin-like protein
MPVCSDKSNSTGDTPDGAGYGRDVYTSRLEVGDFCNGRRATIIGTPGDDPIDGTVGNDVIAGLGGNDAIDGKGGNDVVCGGHGDDTFVQGNAPDGADVLIGGLGSDSADYSARTGQVTVTLDSKRTTGSQRKRERACRERRRAGRATTS